MMQSNLQDNNQILMDINQIDWIRTRMELTLTLYITDERKRTVSNIGIKGSKKYVFEILEIKWIKSDMLSIKVNFPILQVEGSPLKQGKYMFYYEYEWENELTEQSLIYHYSCQEEQLYTHVLRYGNNRYVMDIDVNKLTREMFIETFVYRKKTRKKSLEKRFLKLRVMFFKALFRLFKKITRVKDNKILITSRSRDEISGNILFLYNRLEERGLQNEYKIVKSFKKKPTPLKEFFIDLKVTYHMANSKITVIDDYYPLFYHYQVRKGCEFVQLWHAVGAFKTFGYSRIGKKGGPSPYSKNHKNYTKAIVSSKEIAKYYAEGFGISEEKVIPTGIPRTDIFFNSNYEEKVKEQIYKQYPQLKNKKIITFAPTFRGNGANSAYYDYDMIDYEKLYKLCRNKNYYFIFKVHPFVDEKVIIPEHCKNYMMDASSIREINDLLFITDVLITDYSSTCFEFALFDRPMLFFAYDLEKYIATRDFYYDYTEFVPGKICRSTEELVTAIENQDYEIEKVSEFRHRFFDDVDGKSTDRVIDQIILRKE